MTPETQDPWAAVPVGTIVDSDIWALAAARQLITSNFDGDCVRQACYELRASDVFYDTSLPEDRRRVEVDEKGFVLRPHRAVVCIVREELRLPPDVLGRVLTKGVLFSLGILPVNTYADPGFSGRLGITLVNSSERYVRIRPGEHIAKIEFTRLPKKVERPYHGQHGFDTGIWPIPAHLYADPTELAKEGAIRGESEEFAEIYGPRLAEVRDDLKLYSQLIWVQLLVLIAGFSLVYFLFGHLDLLGSVATGLFTSALATLLVPLIIRRWRRK